MIGRSFKIALTFMLIGIFLYQYLGIFVTVEMGMHELREEFRQQDISKLEIVAIPLQSLQNSREFQKLDASEFRYHGKLYDCAKEKVKGNTAYFYCHHDAEEEDLQQSFDSQQSCWLDAKQAPSKSSAKTFLKVFTQDIILNTPQYHFSCPSSQWKGAEVSSSISSVSFTIASPPPEYLFA